MAALIPALIQLGISRLRRARRGSGGGGGYSGGGGGYSGGKGGYGGGRGRGGRGDYDGDPNERSMDYQDKNARKEGINPPDLKMPNYNAAAAEALNGLIRANQDLIESYTKE